MTDCETGVIPGTKLAVDWASFMNKQNLVLESLPDSPAQSLRLGNGDAGVMVYGNPDSMHVNIGKNDILDYRSGFDGVPFRNHESFLQTYADRQRPPVHQYLSFLPAGDEGVPDTENLNKYQQKRPSGKPAGTICIRNHHAFRRLASTELHLWDAELVGYSGKPDEWNFRMFSAYARNVIVVELFCRESHPFEIEFIRQQDTSGFIEHPPLHASAGSDMWVKYDYPPDRLNYPEGFEYVLYARVLGGPDMSAAIETRKDKSVAHVQANGRVLVLIAVSTGRDSGDPYAKARSDIDEAESMGIDVLRTEHRNHWHDFWRKSLVRVAQNDFLTKQWFISQYYLGCCWKPGCLAPGLFGPWIWEDAPPFGNDYHWDYNMQQAIWGAFSSNHMPLTLPYFDAIDSLLPAAKTEARDGYGLDGAKFFLTSWPGKCDYNPYPIVHYNQMMSINGWVSHPFWWYYLYSNDLDFLKERAYPVLKECAIFYEGYLTRAEDGKYDIWPTAMWDLPLSKHLERNKNCVMDLAFIKYVMKACIAAAMKLDVDRDRISVWHDILLHLREYPVAEIVNAHEFIPDLTLHTYPKHSNEVMPGKVYVNFAGMPVVRNNTPAVCTVVFPGEDAGLDSSRQSKDIAWRTISNTPFYLEDDLILLSMAYVRLGQLDLDLFENLTKAVRMENGGLVYSNFPHNMLVNGCGWPIVINEAIVQSYSGKIRMNPVNMRTPVQFANLRCVGAFLVSGEIRSDGWISYITIKSETRSSCLMHRPWSGELRIRVFPSMSEVPFTERNEVIQFDAEQEYTYIVDHPQEPWEDIPFTCLF